LKTLNIYAEEYGRDYSSKESERCPYESVSREFDRFL